MTRNMKKRLAALVLALSIVLQLVPAVRSADVCTIEEHTHEQDCYAKCEIPEWEGHVHEDACYDKLLICEETEQEPHTHSDACRALLCTVSDHAHEDSCYGTCEIPEGEGHAHTDTCYDMALICKEEVQTPHTHSDACTPLVCTAAEHVHDESCSMEPEQGEPTVSEPEEEKSLHEKLLAAESLEELVTLLEENLEEAQTLTEAQIDDLETHAKALQETAPDDELYENVMTSVGALRELFAEADVEMNQVAAQGTYVSALAEEGTEPITWGDAIYRENSYRYPNVAVAAGLFESIVVSVNNGKVSSGETNFYPSWSTSLSVADDANNNETEVAEILKTLRFQPDAGKTMTITLSLGIKSMDSAEYPGLVELEIDGIKHYYLYVSVEDGTPLTWTGAYERANTYIFRGMQGYLATITSEEENNAVVAACGDQTGVIKAAWIGATCVRVDGEKITSIEQAKGTHTNPGTPFSEADSYLKNAPLYYWACGPEAGQALTYNKWARTGDNGNGGTTNEPNNNDTAPYTFGEAYACVNYGRAYLWNDLANDNTASIKGYVFEFSPYQGGQTDTVSSTTELYDKMDAAVTWNKAVWSDAEDGYRYPDVSVVESQYTAVTLEVTNGTFSVNGKEFTSWGKELQVNEDEDNHQSVMNVLKNILFQPDVGEVMDITVTLSTSSKTTVDPANMTSLQIDGTTHYYQYVALEKQYWTTAYQAAAQQSYHGMTGYLATIISEDENTAVTEAAKNGTDKVQVSWIASTDALVEGEKITNADLAAGTHTNPAGTSTSTTVVAPLHYWAAGPEAGRLLSDYGYTNWNEGEPNNSGGQEMYASIIDTKPGLWNDLSDKNAESSIAGYVVEFSPYGKGFTYSVSDTTSLSYVPGHAVSWNDAVWNSEDYYTYPNVQVADRRYYTMVLSVSGGTFSYGGETGLATYETSWLPGGKSGTEVEAMLKAFQFHLEDGKTMTIKVTLGTSKKSDAILGTPTSVVLDGKTHYYACIEEDVPWNEAYKLAETYIYQGMTGYLASITSEDENNAILRTLSNDATHVWIGGTTALVDNEPITSSTQIKDPFTYTNPGSGLKGDAYKPYFYWAAGPEAGEKFSFRNWSGTSEPNNTPNSTSETEYDGECFVMLYNYGDNLGQWNDAVEVKTGTIKGYVVEFSPYENGLAASVSDETELKMTLSVTDTVKEGVHYDGFSDGATEASVLKDRAFTIQYNFAAPYSNVSFVLDKALPKGTKLTLLEDKTWRAYSYVLGGAETTVSIDAFEPMSGDNAVAADALQFILCVDLPDTNTAEETYTISLKDNVSDYPNGGVRVALTDFGNVSVSAAAGGANALTANAKVAGVTGKDHSLIVELQNAEGQAVDYPAGTEVTIGRDTVKLHDNRAILAGVSDGDYEISMTHLSAGSYRLRVSLAQETTPKYPMQEVAASAATDTVTVTSAAVAIKATLTSGNRVLPSTGGSVSFAVTAKGTSMVDWVLQKKNIGALDSYVNVDGVHQDVPIGDIAAEIPANNTENAVTYRLLFSSGTATFPYNIIVLPKTE